jgi:hypothetical protein
MSQCHKAVKGNTCIGCSLRRSSSIEAAKAIHLFNALLLLNDSMHGPLRSKSKSCSRKAPPYFRKDRSSAEWLGSRTSPSLSLEALLRSRAFALHYCGKIMEYYVVKACAMHVVSLFCAYASGFACTMLHICIKRRVEFLSNNPKSAPGCHCDLCSTHEI